MENVRLTVDGKELTVPRDWTVLQAAEKAGVEIPTLCYHPELEVFNSCLLCVVEVQGARRPLLACGTTVREGMVVQTNTSLLKATRKMALELLVSEHTGDCIAPCKLTCPAHCDIQGFIASIGERDYAEALRIIKDDIPLPAALGRVCPAPCEDACRRNRVEDRLAIRELKRFPADWDLANEQTYKPEVAPDSGFKVAVVGAGPAGLSAAYYLRQMGHAVTIFEAQDEPGGMLRYGIPAYRLPRETLAAEIQTITTDMGVEMRYGVQVGCDVSITDLQTEYDAVFLGIGAWVSRGMNIAGEDSEGVWGGIDFLGAVARGEKVEIGKRVITVGGGNTAIDASRTALRLGAKSSIYYRRSRPEMPAEDIEIEDAGDEGVEFNFLVTPIKIEKNGSGLVVTNIRMELGPPDASGRRRPVPIEGSEFSVECDTVIMAIGQAVDPACVENTGVELDRWGCIATDEKTLQTSLPGIFAGGDGVTGPDIAVRAVGAGHRAAFSIDQYLRGEQIIGRPEEWNVSMGELEQVSEARFAHVQKAERVHMPYLEMEKRLTTWEEVELGLPEEQAVSEAQRCLECGCAAVDTCQLRSYSIEYQVDAKRFAGASKEYTRDTSHPALMHESGKCILCGMCVRMCRDVKGLNVFTFVNRGFDAVVRPYFEMPLAQTSCDGCLKCVEVCPTGALLAQELLLVEA